MLRYTYIACLVECAILLIYHTEQKSAAATKCWHIIYKMFYVRWLSTCKMFTLI